MSALEPIDFAFDVIGDIHGQLATLERLGEALGYRTDADWSHPAGRRLVFIGDLVDRGPKSLEVAELVRGLCVDGSAVCLLGNHELNLVEWRHGVSEPKKSNRATIDDIVARPERWDPVLDFFEGLPIALDFEDLRVVHATWQVGCVSDLRGALGDESAEHPVHPRWRPHVALHAAFEGRALRAGVPTEPFADQSETALDVLLKGQESPAPESFVDQDGRLRDQIRTEWWRSEHPGIARDKRIVFGHYWNMPPLTGVHGSFVAPFPSGHSNLRKWIKEHHESVAAQGRVAVPETAGAVCIDYNGVTLGGSRACVGAYRHPEAEVVWATGVVDGRARL